MERKITAAIMSEPTQMYRKKGIKQVNSSYLDC